MQILFVKIVLRHPRMVLAALTIILVFLAFQAAKLEVDASAESLVLEDDDDLRFSRIINARYKTPDFLVITYSPQDDLLADNTLDNIRRLKEELIGIPGVSSVLSLLDVPLLESPPKPIKELLKDVPNLESPGVDKKLAKQEFLNSAIYRNLLVSPDFKTTGIQINLVEDVAWGDFINRRYTLREEQRRGTLTDKGRTELAQIEVDFKQHREKVRSKLHDTIVQVRSVMDGYRGDAELFLGGVPMIADDLITFVKNDLMVFGVGVGIFLVLTLWFIFRQLRWILLPLLTCSMSVLATAGLLGMFDWEVTVISSNFISLQIIITMAITIHLIVRYREVVADHPNGSPQENVLETARSMWKPCLFMALTTIAGFSSLLLSNILPIINFGWMMASGIAVSLILTFLIFPAMLVQMPNLQPNTGFESRFELTRKLGTLTEHHGRAIVVASGILAAVCVAGASQLIVENSFIDYFKSSTEIYQGMEVIDRQLGGTTPLDIVLQFNPDEEVQGAKKDAAIEKEDEAGGEFDEFEEEFEAAKGEAQYWFTADKMLEVERVHRYLESLKEIGKVLSLGTMLKVGEALNDGKPLDNFMLALIYNELPKQYREIILDPYVSVEDNQVRFYVRVRDSDRSLRRDRLLKKIQHDLHNKLGLPEERYRLTGILVLYNNMLQSLFDSQILTLGAVIAVLMVMFLILFRSLKIAIVAIIPNVLSVGVVLGLMGWARIPLDLMTITIAAISVGIAVDDTIHYIHRFRLEYDLDGRYLAAMHRSHGSIGYAMYYTSMTIIIGFSVLVLSNFIPSIYFGLLTGLAMVVALISALTLLPQLILLLKPFGPDRGAMSALPASE
ncbi:MAG: MMPL family transporter [SAR324 cluster bacterium]|nr:MMPL family transporter [SAR324 cluster bacterium]